MRVSLGRRLVVHGRVQGVFYRGWAVETARSLGLDGWVRNRGDGSVEMVIAGDETAMDEMIARSRQGPPAALVTGIEIADTDLEVPAGFEGRPTV